MNARFLGSPTHAPGVLLRLAVFFLAVSLAGCKPSATGEGPGAKGRADMPVSVKIGEATQQSMPEQISTIGTVEPLQTVQVKAQVSGQVMEVRFTEGDPVQAGQVLFIIDKRPYEVALAQAEANLSKSNALTEQAKAMLARDQALAERTASFFTRDQGLFDKGMISKEEYDKSRADARSTKAAVDADQASINAAMESVTAAKGAIDQAKLQLEYCTITAPIAGQTGVVTAKMGNLVRAGDVAAMVTINQITPIRVDFALPEHHLSTVQKYLALGPLSVQALLKGEESAPCTGTLSFVDNAVDPTTGTIKLKAQFENADRRLWPGQFVQILLQVTVTADATVLPSRAVQTGQKGSYVYVATPEMTAELRPVTIGETAGDLTVIREGVKPGEKVVTDGQLLLKPDAKIKIADEPQAGAERKP